MVASNSDGVYAFPSSFVVTVCLPSKLKTPLVQRTNGVVVPPAGSRSGALRSSRAPGSGLLAARYRAPGARLASDVHPLVPARLTPSRARSEAVRALLLSVSAVKAGSVARAIHRPAVPYSRSDEAS